MRLNLSDELEVEFINEHDKPVTELSLCHGVISYLCAGQIYVNCEKVKTENILSMTTHIDFIIATSTKHELLIWSAPDFGKNKEILSVFYRNSYF